MNLEMAYSNSPSSIFHAQTQCRSVHARGFTLDKKTVENQDWATGPPGCWAVAGRGPAFSKTRLGRLICEHARANFRTSSPNGRPDSSSLSCIKI